MTTNGLVGLGDHGHHIVAAFHEPLKGSSSKLGCSHEDNAQIFLIHH